MGKQLKVRLGLDDANFRQGMARSKQEINQLGSAFRQALSFAGGQLIVDGIKQGLKDTVIEGLNFNDTIQQATLSFKTMLKSAADGTAQVREIWELAKETPLEFPALLIASKRMIAFKFAAADVKGMLTTIGDASSALGLGADGINRVSLALGQMKMKGKVSGEEMRQLAEAGINAWDYLATALNKTVAETQKLSEKGLIPAQQAISVILAGMRQDFGGGMRELAGTYTGLMSTLKDSTREAFGVIMKPAFNDLTNNILPGAIKKVGEFTEGFKQGGLQGGITAMFPPEDSERINKVLKDISASFSVLLQLGVGAGTEIGNMGKFIADNWETVAPIIMGVTAAWISYKTAIIAITVAQAALNGVASANPFILLATAIIGVTAAINGYNKVQEEARRQTINTALSKVEEISKTQQLINEYYILKGITNQTTGEKEKLKQVEQQLIDKIPQATKLIDSQTISLEQQKRTLEDLIRTKDKDTLQAGKLAAEAAIPDLEKELETLRKQEEMGKKWLSGETRNQYGSIFSKDEKVWKDGLSKTITKRQEIEKEIQKAEKAIDAYNRYVSGADYKRKVLFGDKEVSDVAEKLKKEKEQAEKELASARGKAQSEADASAEAAAAALRDAMKGMSSETDKYFKKMSDGLKSFFADIRSQRDELADFGNMFERNVIEKFSPEKIQSRLNRFLKQFQDWRANLSDLMGKGVDQGVLEQLRSMGLQGAGIAAGMNRMSAQQLANAMNSIGQIRGAATSEATKTVIYRHELDLSGSMDVKGYTTDGELQRIKSIVASDIADSLNKTDIPISGATGRRANP